MREGLYKADENTAQVFYLCQRCGNCCRWPGFVILRGDDVDRMAQGLAIAPHDFIEKFCDLHPNRKMLVLKTKPDGACIFLEGQNHCQVQANKPGQCAGFPNRWRFDGWREWCEALEIPK